MTSCRGINWQCILAIVALLWAGMAWAQDSDSSGSQDSQQSETENSQPLAKAGETVTEKLTVDDVDRKYLIHIPLGYDGKQRFPVVVLLHATNQDSDDMSRLTHFDQIADKNGVITVYPSALHGRWNIGAHFLERPTSPMSPGRRPFGFPGGYPGGGGGYPGGYPGGGGGYPGGNPGGQRPNAPPKHKEQGPVSNDVNYLNQVLDAVSLRYSVDASRIYVTGLSDGGFMAIKAGCSMADRVAAVAAVGAAMPRNFACLPARPVSVLMINGTSDPIVRYSGGSDKDADVSTLSVEETAKQFAKLDHCSEKPEQDKISPKEKGGMETKVNTFTGCQDNSQVALYSIKGGGNTWPGGEQYSSDQDVGKTSNDINGDQTIWDFFATKKLASDNHASNSNPEQK